MKKFNDTQRILLLTGSKVKCIKDVKAHPYLLKITPDKGSNDFSTGKIYEVPFANNLLGDVGGSHTFDIAFFRQHFIELPSTSF